MSDDPKRDEDLDDAEAARQQQVDEDAQYTEYMRQHFGVEQASAPTSDDEDAQYNAYMRQHFPHVAR